MTKNTTRQGFKLTSQTLLWVWNNTSLTLNIVPLVADKGDKNRSQFSLTILTSVCEEEEDADTQH